MADCDACTYPGRPQPASSNSSNQATTLPGTTCGTFKATIVASSAASEPLRRRPHCTQ
jgi:hypothetical protein